MAIHVEIRFPDGQKRSMVFSKSMVFIGRRDVNDVVLTFPFVSGRHCRLIEHGERLLVEDLGSTNGTLVNGEPLPAQTPHTLRPEDVIQIGTVEIRTHRIVEAAVESEPPVTVMERAPATAPEASPASAAHASSVTVQETARPRMDGPATMWEIQTGVYQSAAIQLDDTKVGGTAGIASAVPPRAFRVRASRAALAAPAIRTDRYRFWSWVFQIVGWVIVFGGIVALVIVLLS